MKGLVLVLVSGMLSAQPSGVETIHHQWGSTTHRPNALARTMKVHEQAFNKAFPEVRNEPRWGSFEQRLENRINAAKVTLHLPEVVSVQINHTIGGKQCKIADPKDCIDTPKTIVIELRDVDGNVASIWTGSNDDSKPLPVTGVEPY